MDANWRYKRNIQETYKIMKLIYVKRTFKTPWKETESTFKIQKSFIPVCGRWEDSCMTHSGKFWYFFLLCLKSNFYFGNWKFQKLFFKGYGFVIKFELDNLPHQVSQPQL